MENRNFSVRPDDQWLSIYEAAVEHWQICQVCKLHTNEPIWGMGKLCSYNRKLYYQRMHIGLN